MIVAVIAGLTFTAERKLMWNRWILSAGCIAFLMFLPNLVWMMQHDFPHLELLANIKRNGRDVQFSPLQFLGMQAVLMNALALPIWLSGLWSI